MIVKKRKCIGLQKPFKKRVSERGESLTILSTKREENGVVCFKRENTLTDMLPRYEEAQDAFED